MEVTTNKEIDQNIRYLCQTTLEPLKDCGVQTWQNSNEMKKHPTTIDCDQHVANTCTHLIKKAHIWSNKVGQLGRYSWFLTCIL